MMKVALGIDMGGTCIKMALVTNGNRLVNERTVESESHLNMDERLEKLVEDVGKMLEDKYELYGIGIAFPGIVDHKNHRILSKYVKYPNAHLTDLRAWAMKNWGIPLILENDARAALVGEWKYGVGKGSKNVLMVTLGTGMGSAVIIESKLLRGTHFLAGNLGGHMTIDFQGEQCNCGNIGCVETVGSTWALPKNFEKHEDFQNSSLAKLETIGYKNIFNEATNGDDVAKKIKERSMESWAAGIINLLHAYDPEKLILGGGIMESKDEIIPFIKEKIKKLSWLPENGVDIVCAQNTKQAGIIGVSYLIKNNCI